VNLENPGRNFHFLQSQLGVIRLEISFERIGDPSEGSADLTQDSFIGFGIRPGLPGDLRKQEWNEQKHDSQLHRFQLVIPFLFPEGRLRNPIAQQNRPDDARHPVHPGSSPEGQ
jgi:hypothetical protein